MPRRIFKVSYKSELCNGIVYICANSAAEAKRLAKFMTGVKIKNMRIEDTALCILDE